MDNQKVSEAILAYRGLVELLGQDWMETRYHSSVKSDKEIEMEVIENYDHIDSMISLWEDIQLIKDICGFDKLFLKLKDGLRNQNVDLEISIAADIIRCNGEFFEFEPLVENGPNYSDYRFKVPGSDSWVYVEITRRSNSQINSEMHEFGNKLAKLVSLINPQKRCVVVLKKEITREEFIKISNWLNSKPQEGDFLDIAIYFTVPSNTDDSIRVLSLVSVPILVESFMAFDGSQGVCYIYLNDEFKRILKGKRDQLPKNEQGVVFLDLSNVLGRLSFNKPKIVFGQTINHFSAVAIFKDGEYSNGLTREMEIINNSQSTNKLNSFSLAFLQKLTSVRRPKN